jgi:D-glycero-alpha-D-manno-heptose-7-phosphate kinase
MILARSPLRISLGGGGTDLPTYYERFGGFVVSAAINKYVYVAISRPFSHKLIIKYSNYESVENVNEISHPIIREVLKCYGTGPSGIEISTMADVPAGTGLGSSGSFTTALIKGLFAYHGKEIQPHELASSACDIEMIKLSEPVGKQDQYVSAFGGVSTYHFLKTGEVNVEPLTLSSSVLSELNKNLLLFYTGKTRSASNILKDQVLKTQSGDQNMIENLNYIKKLGLKSLDALLGGDLENFGELMNDHWEFKKSRSIGMSNEKINVAYQEAVNNGAIGGKLVGAGGGGFLMFYANDSQKLRMSMENLGLEELQFELDFAGTSILIPS